MPTDRGRAGEWPTMGLTLLMLENDANLTGFGPNWNHNNRAGEVSGNACTLSERCSWGGV